MEANVEEEVGQCQMTLTAGIDGSSSVFLIPLEWKPTDQAETAISTQPQSNESIEPRRSTRTSRPPERLDPSWVRH